jgi:formate dehydrogenase major subunit
MNPDDLTELAVGPDGYVTLSTRRGSITLKARATPGVTRGNVFVPFHFREASANMLTNDVLDPFGKIPEFKFCAVKVEKAEPHA